MYDFTMESDDELEARLKEVLGELLRAEKIAAAWKRQGQAIQDEQRARRKIATIHIS